MELIPEKFKTKELCELAVSTSGWALEYAPEEFKTKELCETAVTQNPYALQYVPDEHRGIEMCELALNHVDYDFKDEFLESYVPEAFQKEVLNDLDIETPTKTVDKGR